MKGEITLKVTHETVIAALQLYFGTQFAEGKVPQVESVQPESTSYQISTFVVKAQSAT